MTSTRAAQSSVERAAESLLNLDAQRPELSAMLAKFVTVVADEAARTPRFANTLTAAFKPVDAIDQKPKRARRRAPGVIDPFAVYGDAGEDGLRRQLSELDLEQLRDIIAESGMDQDRLAMKWKDSRRVVDRIVEKVAARAAKGSAFRSAPD